jgi:hypothetical protein
MLAVDIPNLLADVIALINTYRRPFGAARWSVRVPL